MIDNLQEAEKQFAAHVPNSEAVFIVLKAHLVIEMRLIEFIKARISPELYKEVSSSSECSFHVRLFLARALSERDEIPTEDAHILWPALRRLGNLRNDVAHLLEHKGTSLDDKMRAFVEAVDPLGKVFGKATSAKELHGTFRIAANYLNSLLAIDCEPLFAADEQP